MPRKIGKVQDGLDQAIAGAETFVDETAEPVVKNTALAEEGVHVTIAKINVKKFTGGGDYIRDADGNLIKVR